MAVTSGKITDTIKALARATEAISLFVYAGGRVGAVMPVAQFDQFQFMKLDKPIMPPSPRTRPTSAGSNSAPNGTAVWTALKTN